MRRSIQVSTLLCLLAFGCNRSHKADGNVSPGSSTPTTGSQSKSERAVPVIGGTLLVTSHGVAIVSDPDRDRVMTVSLAKRSLEETIELGEGAFPGKATEGADGEVFVALRGTGEVLQLSSKGKELGRHQACANVRGLAWLEAKKAVVVACAEGEVLLMSPAGKVMEREQPAADLRDVLVTTAGRIFISTFREARLFELNQDLKVINQFEPPTTADAVGAELIPRVVWDLVEGTSGEVLTLHQHAATRELTSTTSSSGSPAYYGNAGLPIVETALTSFGDDGPTSTQGLPGEVLTVDADVDPNSGDVLLVSAGSFSFSRSAGAVREFGLMEAQPIAGAFYDGNVVIQTREPSTLQLFDGTSFFAKIKLGGDNVASTGHAVFHGTAEGPAASVTCASCHPEGRDDAHTWNFGGAVGLRRTQTLLGGVSETKPFHWSGDITSMDHLMSEVFTKRMGNRELTGEEVARFEEWLSELELMTPVDSPEVHAGAKAFEDAGCLDCHSGSRFSNDKNKNVGTGEFFQTPSLLGLRFRAPYMHDGCAADLRARFEPNCGGNKHGNFDDLSKDEQELLLGYLESL